MSLPHVCECRVCGATFPLGSPLGVHIPGVTFEGAAPVPTGTIELQKPATCIHGYTICRPCKFPAV